MNGVTCGVGFASFFAYLVSRTWCDECSNLRCVLLLQLVASGFFYFIDKRNSSPTLQRSRRMSCRPNPSLDSAKVWLLPLPIELSLHILRFVYGLFLFQPRFSFHFLSVHFSPIHNTTVLPTIYTQPPYFRFVSSFQFLYYTVHQHLLTYLHMPVRKTTPDKTHNSQWHMYVFSNTYSTSTL